MSNIFTQSFDVDATPSGWVVDDAAGTVTFSDGVLSLASGSSAAVVKVTTHEFSATPTIDIHFKFTVPTYPATSNMDLLLITGAGDVELCSLAVSNSVARLKMTHGSIQTNGPSDLISATEYHGFLSYTAGTGANGIASLYYGTDSARGSVKAEIVIGDATDSATKLVFQQQGRVGGAVIIDDIVADTTIGAAEAPTAGDPAPVISAVGTINLGEVFTVTVDSYEVGAKIHADGNELTTAETNGTTLTGTFPATGYAIGANVDITVVDSNGTSDPSSDTIGAPLGFTYAVSDTAYADLLYTSILYERAAFNILASGDIIAIESPITIESTEYNLSINSGAVIRYPGNMPDGTYTDLVLNMYDASDSYALTTGLFNLVVEQGEIVSISSGSFILSLNISLSI